MQIKVQETPNPNARKFILPAAHFARPTNFPSAASATDEPLASTIFALGSVYNVFWAQDFVTVNKYPDIPWEPLSDQIVTVLRDYLVMEKQ